MKVLVQNNQNEDRWIHLISPLLLLWSPLGKLEMAIEDYLCSLLLSRCGHALLATGKWSDASCNVGLGYSYSM